MYRMYKDQIDENRPHLTDLNNLRMYLHNGNQTPNVNYQANRYTANAGGGQIGAIFTTDTDGFPSHQFVSLNFKFLL